MKTHGFKSILCLGIVSLLGGTLLAQNTPGAAGAQNQNADRLNQQRPALGTPGAQGAAQIQTQSMQQQVLRLGQIIGNPILGEEGQQPIGIIRDLAVDPQTGRVELALVALPSAGEATPGQPGAAGARDIKVVAIPWQLLNAASATVQAGAQPGQPGQPGQQGRPGAVVFKLTGEADKLQNAPSFEISTFMGNYNQFAERVYTHFGLDYNARTSVGGAGAGITTGAGKAQTEQEEEIEEQPEKKPEDQ